MSDRIERAAESLDFDPNDVALFEAVVQHLEAKKDWKTVDRAYRAMLRKVNATGDLELEKKLWTRLGLLYQYRLKDADAAITAFEMRMKLEPDHGTLLALGNAYEVASRIDEAAFAYEVAARAEPLDADAYNRIFEMRRERAGDLDATYRAAQSLVALKAPVEDATEMVVRLLPTRLPELRPLSRPDWKDLWSPHEPGLVSNILRFVPAPTPRTAPTFPARPELVRWAARILGAEGDDGGEIRSGADLDAVKDGRLFREEMFHAGREAAALVWSHYEWARARPNEIAAALFAAIHIVKPSVQIPPEHAGAFAYVAAVEPHLSAVQRERLAKVVELFFSNGAEMNVDSWQRAVRITRLRAGILVAGGVGGLRHVLETDDDELPGAVKLRDALSWNVGSAHATLRQTIGWAMKKTEPEEAANAAAAAADDDDDDDDVSDAAITWVTAHPDGRWIAVGDFGGRILVWAPEENRIVAQQKLGGRITRVEWTADGAHLVAIAEGDDRLHVLSADGASVPRTIATGHGEVRGLAVHPSKPWAATAGADSHLRVWDVANGNTIFEKKTLKPGSVCALSETLVAVGSEIGEFDVWETLTTKPKAGGELFTGTYVSAMAFSPDGNSLVMGGGNGKLVRFDVTEDWKLAHQWKELPPKPIATNDIRYRDDTTWIAAHSDDRASLFLRPADASPTDLGQPFWLERGKPWDREYIVSAACFVPGTKAIVTAHFSGRLRVWSERAPGMWLRAGDVVFDPKNGTPETVGPIDKLFPASPPPPPPAKASPKSTRDSIVIGDRNHRARTIEEMELAASLRPCATCTAAPADLAVTGEGDELTLGGKCRFCATPVSFTFFVEGDPAKLRPKRYEIGDERPSTMVEPRELTAELERLRERGIDDSNRERALTCIIELLKFPLIRDGERGDGLRAERERLLAEVKPEAPVETIIRALSLRAQTPRCLGELEAALGVRVELDVKTFWPRSKIELTLPGFVKQLSFEPIWDIHHQQPPKDADEARTFALALWSAMLAGGAAQVQDALRRAFGAPSARPNCHVYGEHWVVQTRGDEILLTWAERIPDWAQHVDERIREHALVALAKRICEARDGGELASAGGAIPPDAGIAARRSDENGVSLELVPAMPVVELARILGWPEVVAQTQDINGARYWVRVPTADPHAPAPPRIGRWKVTVAVDGRGPTGGPVDGSAERAYHLQIRCFGPKDLVRHVHIAAS